MTAAGIQPVTLELLDQFTIRAVDDMHGLGLDRDAAAMLLIESDLPEAAAAAELDEAVRVCESVGATLVVRAADATEGDWLRQARRLAYQALERIGTVKMEDIGVPRSRVPEMLVRIEEVVRAVRRPVRHVRPRGRRQPAPEPRVRPRRSARRRDHRAA